MIQHTELTYACNCCGTTSERRLASLGVPDNWIFFKPKAIDLGDRPPEAHICPLCKDLIQAAIEIPF